MIPTEDLEDYRDFLMQACDELPSSKGLTATEQDIKNKLFMLQVAVDCELATRGTTYEFQRQEPDPPPVNRADLADVLGRIHQAIKQEEPDNG